MNKLKTIARIDRHLKWLDKHSNPELQEIRETLFSCRNHLVQYTPKAEIPPTVADMVIDVVTEYHDIGYAQLAGKSRLQKIVTARHQAGYLLRMYTDLSLEEIGELLGRIHCTVMHSLKVVRNMLDIGDHEYRQALAIMPELIEKKMAAQKGGIEHISITEKQAS